MRQIYIAADYHDWQSIKDRFLMTMLEFGIASAHIYHDPQGKQLLVVFGTATATLILPIDQARADLGDEESPLRQMVPQELAYLFEHGRVVLCGTEIDYAVDQLGVGTDWMDGYSDGCAMIDTRDFVERALATRHLEELWPDLRDTTPRSLGWMAAKIRGGSHNLDFDVYQRRGDFSRLYRLDPANEPPLRIDEVMRRTFLTNLRDPSVMAYLFGASRAPIDIVLSAVLFKAEHRLGFGWAGFEGISLAICVWETAAPAFVRRQTEQQISGYAEGENPVVDWGGPTGEGPASRGRGAGPFGRRGRTQERGHQTQGTSQSARGASQPSRTLSPPPRPAPEQPLRGQRRGTRGRAYEYGWHDNLMQELGETHEQRRDTDHYYDIRSGSEGHHSGSESDEEDSRTPQTQTAPAASTEERQATTTSTTAPAAPAVSTEERQATAATTTEEQPRAPQSQAQQGAVPRRPAPPRTATPARRGRATEERTHRPPVPTQGSGIILPPRPAICEPQSWTDPPTIYDDAMYPPSLATRVIIQGCVKCGCAKHGGRYCPINPNILKCVYCGFRQHFVHSCQILQSACPICWYRGHGNDPKCPGNRDVQKDFLRFERYADFGEKSRLRTEQGCWGYGFWWTPIDLGLQELPVHEGQGDGHCWRSSRDPTRNPDLRGVRHDVVGSETGRTEASQPGPSPKSQRAYLRTFGSRTGRLGRHDGTLHLQASQRPRASQRRRRATAATSASASAAGSAVRPHVQGRGMVD